jgi:Tol biopolymer transport system component
VPLDGSSAGFQVGPAAPCTAAAWSPDGAIMYFTAGAAGASHIWRQGFPHGAVEPVTSGPEQEFGVALSPDGRSIFTSAGLEESGVWLREGDDERLLTGEGYAWAPSYSADGGQIYYVRQRTLGVAARDLWRSDLQSRRSEPLITGFALTSYQVSRDGRRVVFAAEPPDGPPQIWIASLDRSSPPRRLTDSGEGRPAFAGNGDIVFAAAEGPQNFLFRMKDDGSARTKVRAAPILNFLGTSPDGRWALALAPSTAPPTNVLAVPLDGDAADVVICRAICSARWSPDGSRFYVEALPDWDRGLGLALPVAAGRGLPVLPAGGLTSIADSADLPGSAVVNLSIARRTAAPGPAPGTFAYVRTLVHRNIFRIGVS